MFMWLITFIYIYILPNNSQDMFAPLRNQAFGPLAHPTIGIQFLTYVKSIAQIRIAQNFFKILFL